MSQIDADIYGVKMVELDELLQQSDYITIHSSATKETYHLINEDRLAMMKSTALLVNTARDHCRWTLWRGREKKVLSKVRVLM